MNTAKPTGHMFSASKQMCSTH